MNETFLYVVELIGAIVAGIRPVPSSPPYYMYDHPMAINSRLLVKDKSKEQKTEKYPLIALRMDFPEDVKGGIVHLNLNLAILSYTNRNYLMEQRYEHVFKPTLYPLYHQFIEGIKTSGKFFWPDDQDSPPHVKIDRPYYGNYVSQGNVKNWFSDPLDAIEIINLKINTLFKQC